jgi:hypothetical protein
MHRETVGIGLRRGASNLWGSFKDSGGSKSGENQVTGLKKSRSSSHKVSDPLKKSTLDESPIQKAIRFGLLKNVSALARWFAQPCVRSISGVAGLDGRCTFRRPTSLVSAPSLSRFFPQMPSLFDAISPTFVRAVRRQVLQAFSIFSTFSLIYYRPCRS